MLLDKLQKSILLSLCYTYNKTGNNVVISAEPMTAAQCRAFSVFEIDYVWIFKMRIIIEACDGKWLCTYRWNSVGGIC